MVALPKVTLSTEMDDGLCFGCGQNNPIGLKLKFSRDGNIIRSEFTPSQHHQGWPGVVHGGIIISVLDEAMSYATYLEGINCLTATMEAKFKRLAKVEEPLVVTSSITKHTRKLIKTKAKVSLRDGTLVAESTATQFIVETKPGDASDKKEPQSDA